MGIFRFPRGLTSLFWRPSADLDYLLDAWICDAFLEDAAVQPPQGAWERLRNAITDRRPVRSHGMWILDEPLRDPPESLPGTLSDQQYERAQRIYRHDRAGRRSQFKEAVWSNFLPAFVALVNL